MQESRELQAARRLLAEAEARLDVPEGLASLAEGLELLEGVISGGGARQAGTARNLAASYASRIYARVGDLVGRSRQVPEPELEHYFKVALAFDPLHAALPPAAAKLKIAVAKALIERYYEGHPPERKRAALAELAKLR